MALLGDRRYLLALGPAIVVVALAVGIPTDVLPNPWFTRMTPVRPLDVALLPLTSISVGALLATLALPRAQGARGNAVATGAGGGVMSAFAVGCPVCNKLVVLALGFSGALTYFEPIQPMLGIGAVVIALVALRRRARARSSACPLPPAEPRVAAER